MRSRHLVSHYGVAVLATALAFLVSLALRALLVDTPSALFFVAVAVSAWTGGLFPGMVTTVLSVLATGYLFFEPLLNPRLSHRDVPVSLGEIVVIGAFFAVLMSSLRSSRDRAQRNLAMLDTFFSAAPVGMAFVDRDLRYVRVNEAMARLNGVPVRDHLGRTVGEVIPSIAPIVEPVLRRVLATGEPVVNREMSDEQRAAIGARRDVLASYYPIRDRQGTTLGVGAVVLDVTASRRAEEARERIAGQFQLLLESTGEGIYGIDLRGRCTFINRAGAEMLGYRPDDVLDQNMHALIHDRRPDGSPYPESECPIYRAFHTGRGVRVGDEVFWRRTGSAFPVEYSSFPIVQRGRIEGAVVTFVDITMRKQAEEVRNRLALEQAARSATELERARLETILKSAPSGIVVVDAKTDRMTANPTAIQIFGHPMDSPASRAQYAAQLRRADGRPLSIAELPSTHALLGHTTPPEELIVNRPDGRQVPIRGSAAPIRGPHGAILGAVVTFQDLTALKESERLREEWTSMIAHDLRQPVAVISGYADLLARGRERYAPETRTRIDHIRSSARQLSRMIRDLLDVSRIEARRLALECVAVDLPALVRNVVARTAELTRGHPVRVDVIGSIPTLVVDPDRVEQVLTNLLSNAAKYGYPDTEIRLTVTCHRGVVDLSVANQGPGISPEELSRLFTRFYRTPEARAEKVAGLGLGLYIAKGLVTAHGGRIWAESTPGQTTMFHVSLPVQSNGIGRASNAV